MSGTSVAADRSSPSWSSEPLGSRCYAVRRIKMDPQQYIVGGRSFGTIFLWVLLAGEIYTTFTFLGIAGLSYSQGAPAYLRHGLRHVAPTSSATFLRRPSGASAKTPTCSPGPDFFETRYNSRALGVGRRPAVVRDDRALCRAAA